MSNVILLAGALLMPAATVYFMFAAAGMPLPF